MSLNDISLLYVWEEVMRSIYLSYTGGILVGGTVAKCNEIEM